MAKTNDSDDSDGLYQFALGEKVFVYYDGLLYEATCKKRRVTDDGEFQYYVHYAGFNAKFDEWVDDDDVLEINSINIGHKERLESNRLNNPRRPKRAREQSPAGDDLPRPPPRKRGRPKRSVEKPAESAVSNKAVSVVENKATPVVTNEEIPAVENEAISAPEDKATLVVENAKIPAVEDKAPLVVKNEKIPAVEVEAISAVEIKAVPIVENKEIPAVENKAISAVEDKAILVVENKEIPAVENKAISAVEDKAILVVENAKIPAVEDKATLVVDNEKITAVEIKAVPVVQNEEISAVEVEKNSAVENKAIPVVANGGFMGFEEEEISALVNEVVANLENEGFMGFKEKEEISSVENKAILVVGNENITAVENKVISVLKNDGFMGFEEEEKILAVKNKTIPGIENEDIPAFDNIAIRLFKNNDSLVFGGISAIKYKTIPVEENKDIPAVDNAAITVFKNNDSFIFEEEEEEETSSIEFEANPIVGNDDITAVKNEDIKAVINGVFPGMEISNLETEGFIVFGEDGIPSLEDLGIPVLEDIDIQAFEDIVSPVVDNEVNLDVGDAAPVQDFANGILNIIPRSELLANELKKYEVPPVLKDATEFDCSILQTHQITLKFADENFVAEVLYKFTKSSYFIDTQNKYSVLFPVTLMTYFNLTVHSHLLLKKEKKSNLQNKGMSYFRQRMKDRPDIKYVFKNHLNPKKIWCYLYGPMYLLRLIVRLPKIVTLYPLDPEYDVDSFVLHIKQLCQFLLDNFDSFFKPYDYVSYPEKDA